MSRLQLRSSAEQVAMHLRAELASGRLCGSMPGVLRLELDLGVNRKAVDAALQQLEREGLLVAQGAGKVAAPQLRVAILPGEAAEQRLDYIVELQHELAGAGHAAVNAPKTMVELGMDVRRIARMVEKTEADAWVVMAGSREVLEWFSSKPVPAFALFGRRIVKWAENVSCGKQDVSQTLTPAEFVPGGTIGPAQGISHL